MLSQDLLTKIRHIEIQTRRLLNGALVGDSRSAIKGSGFEFDQIRDYQMGDDIRFIDWKSSLRAGKTLVKQYFEERNRTIVIALDTSSSGLFSSTDITKSEVMAQIASILALVADYGKDTVGLLLFSDTVELFVPPAQGKAHVHTIMQKAFTHPTSRKKTDIAAALHYLAGLPNANATVFLISDCIDQESERLEKLLKLVSKKYDFTVIRCLDTHEERLPDVGMLTLEDPETGQDCVVHIQRGRGRRVQEFLHNRLQWQRSLFRKYKIGHLDVAVHKPFISDLITFFRKRMMY